LIHFQYLTNSFIVASHRDGKDGAIKSPLRAARFYELVNERLHGAQFSDEDNDSLVNRRAAELELAELLEADPTLSTRYSYLGLLISAASKGDADAQHKLSVAYATGVAARDLTPMDAGRALFLEYVSALSGNVMANMGMGYRYNMGIGVTESCEAALPHYQFAADHASESMPIYGVHAHPPDTLKLSEANDPSSRISRRDGTLELADYYAHLAEQGDALAAVTLGNMLLSGTRHLAYNETLALHYLKLAADANNPAGAGMYGYALLNQYLNDIQRMKNEQGLSAAQQYAQSSTDARMRTAHFIPLLRYANQKGDVNGIVGLGVAYFHGVGLRANFTEALNFLERAAAAHPDAGYFIGEICMGLQSMDLSGGGDTSRGKFKKADIGSAPGKVARGGTAAESRVREGQAISHAVQNKEIDPAAAARAYTVSAQLGHVLSQHR
jgi:TPR repeat protein